MTHRSPRAVAIVAAGAVVVSTFVALPSAQAAPPAAQSPQALAVQAANAHVAANRSALFAGSEERFVQRGVASSGSEQFVAYERTYRNLPVIGGDFVVVTDSAGDIESTSVAQSQSISGVAASPTVPSAKARDISATQLSRVDSSATPVLSVLADANRLVWNTRVTGSNGKEPSVLDVYVDALTGAVLGTTEHVADGTGTAAYNGPNPVALATRHSGSTYSMADPVVTSLSCQNASTNTTFSGPDDLWGNGNATNRETGCVDALFAAQTENRMLSQWLGRNSFNGSGGAWPIRVGLADLNAYYDGTQVQIGHNSANQWISSIDVVAHELGHGIDDHTPGGISRSGTQEFIADTFGASTEWFANEPSAYDPPDFLVGEEINLVGSGPIRNMYNPSALGDPNCYSSSIPNGEVHASAGPGNHWFYLLAEGNRPTNGQPTSPTCNGANVTGVGVQKAITILYNAMLRKTTTSSYLKYRTWTLQSAKALYGTATCNTVKAAWDAVSVPAQSGDPVC